MHAGCLTNQDLGAMLPAIGSPAGTGGSRCASCSGGASRCREGRRGASPRLQSALEGLRSRPAPGCSSSCTARLFLCPLIRRWSMRALLPVLLGLLSGCMSSTVLIDGAQVPRQRLEFAGHPYALL